jgi:SAM-dependent methyltransferase
MTTETRSPHFGREATATTYRDIQLPRIFDPWARMLLDFVPPHAGDAVLDVATGPGTVARQGAARVGRNGRVVGIDISAAMLGVARARSVEPGSAPIEYAESSAASMPVPDAAFDVAYCQQGLQHMADPNAALAQIRRALKPGGRLGVALWVRSPSALFREVVVGLGLGGGGQQALNIGRDAAGLVALLRDAGFQDVHVDERSLESVLEGGVPQALELARATSAYAGMEESTAEQQATINAALTAALQPLVQPDGVHLVSVANLASAHT